MSAGADFIGGVGTNAGWDAIQALYRVLVKRPRERRRFARAVETRCGMTLRPRALADILSTDEAFAYLAGGDRRPLAMLLRPAVVDPNPDLDALVFVAEASYQVLLETSDRAVSLGLRTTDAIRDLGASIDAARDQVDRLLPAPVVAGADPLATQLRADELLDRDDDLDALRQVMRWSTGGYAAIVAPPWAGKTALMCDLVAEPPPGTRVVSFFVRKAIGRNRATDFLESANRQLRSFTDAAAEPGEDLARRRANFDHLWRAAADEAAADDEVLVLVVDGLDEQDTSTEPTISQLLPRRVGAHEIVVVATRPNPDAFPGCGAEHQLVEALSDPYALVPSVHARGIEARARADIDLLRRSPRDLPARCFGVLALAGTPLTEADVSDIVMTPGDEIEAAVRSFHNLTLGDGSTDRPWQLAHETLRAAAAEFRADWQAARRAEIEQWLDRWRTRHWPPETPSSLLVNLWHSGYLTSERGVIELAVDAAFVQRACSRVNGPASMLDLTSAAIEALRADEISDDATEDLVRAGLNLVAVLDGARSVPDGYVGALAAVGRWAEVDGLLRETIDDATTIDRAIEALQPSSPDSTRHIALDQVIRIASDAQRAVGLSQAAASIARWDNDAAVTLFESACSIVDDLDATEADEALGALATTRLQVWALSDGDVGAAVDLADRVEDLGARNRAIGQLIPLIARLGPDGVNGLELALATVDLLDAPLSRARGLAKVAHAIGPADESRARELIDRATTEAAGAPRALADMVWGAIGAALVTCANATEDAVTEALALAGRCSRERARRRSVGDVAAAVANVRPPTIDRVRRARHIAEPLAGSEEVDNALAAIAVALASVDPSNDELIDEALALVDKSSDPRVVDGALHHIALMMASLDATDRERVEAAVDLVDDIDDDEARDEAFAALALRVATTSDDHEQVARATVLCRRIRSSEIGLAARCSIATVAADHHSALASALLEDVQRGLTVRPMSARTDDALGSLAGALATRSRDSGAIDAAIDLAIDIASTRTPATRARALATIASAVVSVGRGDDAAIDRAIGLAHGLGDPWSRGRVLGAVAVAAVTARPGDADALERGVEIAASIDDCHHRVTAFAGVAVAATDHPAIRSRIEAEMWVAVERSDDPDERDVALVRLLEAFGADAAPETRQRWIERIVSRYSRDLALAALAEAFVVDSHGAGPADLAAALDIARQIDDVGLRFESVSIVIALSGLEVPDARAALRDQIALVEDALPAEIYAEFQIEHLAAFPTPRNLDEAMALATSVPDLDRDSAVASIAVGRAMLAHDESSLDTALELARSVHVRSNRARALASIARVVQPTNPQRSDLVAREALDAARSTPTFDRWSALNEFVARLADTHPQVVRSAATTPELWRVDMKTAIALAVALLPGPRLLALAPTIVGLAGGAS